jgi:hypothetical protein
MTRSRAGDIAVGAVCGLITLVTAIFTVGISLAILLGAFNKPFSKYPYYRRGVFYGFAAAGLVYLSAFVACVYFVRKL